jgi:hypothetical protein
MSQRRHVMRRRHAGAGTPVRRVERRVHRRCGGQTLMIFALSFALLLFALTCLVADGAFLYRWSDRVQAAAQLAAQSGADAVDAHYLYSGCAATTPCATPIVDIAPQDRAGDRYAFERACIQTGDQSAGVPRHPPDDLTPKTADDSQTPEGSTCASDGCHVYAQVTRVVSLPISLPGFPSSVTVRGRSFAAPVVGTDRGERICAGAAWVPFSP